MPKVSWVDSCIFVFPRKTHGFNIQVIPQHAGSKITRGQLILQICGKDPSLTLATIPNLTLNGMFSPLDQIHWFWGLHISTLRSFWILDLVGHSIPHPLIGGGLYCAFAHEIHEQSLTLWGHRDTKIVGPGEAIYFWWGLLDSPNLVIWWIWVNCFIHGWVKMS